MDKNISDRGLNLELFDSPGSWLGTRGPRGGDAPFQPRGVPRAGRARDPAAPASGA